VTVFDLKKKKEKIIQLEILTQEPEFWKNSQKAIEINQKLAELRKEIDFWETLEKDISKIEKENEEIPGEQLKEIEKRLEKEEIKIFLSGENDKGNAIMSIYTGAGGVDAQDWAEMLLKMYIKYAERKNFKAKVIQITAGQEAGIKNVTLEIDGPYAYGYLKKEAGVHRLVRLSPFNSDNLRQTSFALIELLPDFSEISEEEIQSEDLRIDTYRASGPGGQYVDKTESAIRITHLPTKISVACQSERLQGSNKKKAMKLLRIKLHQKNLQEEEKEKEKFLTKKTAEWGNQICSYVLHPYKMVKDHRTKEETSDIESVLDGELDRFIEAEIRDVKQKNL